MLTRLFWRIVYLFRRRPSDLDGWFRRMERTHKWGPFQPFVYHNQDSPMWHVYFDNESPYSESRTIKVEAHVGIDSGRIVGLTIWDENLEPA